MRVSDEDRQRAVDELRRHCAAGRIDVDEYADRIERALAATSFEELDHVLGDLPYMRIADPSGQRPSRGDLRALSGPAGSAGSGVAGGVRARLVASTTVLVSVLVVVTAVLLLALASWGWAAVLIVGWLIGLAQGRLSGRRSGPSGWRRGQSAPDRSC